MTKKQFTLAAGLVLLLTVVVGYFFYLEPSTARGSCADYAMNLTVQSFPDSFEKTGEEFPPYRLRGGDAENAAANYELFYNFCVNKRGLSS